MFLNLFSVRLQTPLHQPFTPSSNKLRGSLSALANPAVPFDVILDEVKVKRNPTPSQLFQTFIDYGQVNEKQPFGSGELRARSTLSVRRRMMSCWTSLTI